MSDDRASRLRERRRSSKARATPSSDDRGDAEAVSASDSASVEESSMEGEGDDSSGSEAAESDGETSVKEEQVGTYMYLPESQKRELGRVFNVTKAEYEYEYDEEFEKNRHFYPLLVQFGIETLDDADAATVRDLLEEL